MQRKTNLLELLNITYTTGIILVDDLDVAGRSDEGSLENWSAKDTLIHCAYWISELAGNLELVARGETPQRVENIARANDAIFERRRRDTWDMALTAWKDGFERLRQHIQPLSEQDLESVEFFTWQKDRPLWRIIAGTGILHPLSHLAGYASQNSGAQKILLTYEKLLPLLSALDENPGWQALIQYDLACFCALAGEKKRAIQSLKNSLRLSPDFADYAQQDTDLDCLRGEQEFQALFA